MTTPLLDSRRTSNPLVLLLVFSLGLSFGLIFSSGCATRPADSSSRSAGSGSSDIPDELSLRADRSALDEERKGIPEDKRRDNDELAGLLQMIQMKPNQEPGEIRERFNRIARDRRDKSDKLLRTRREAFDKTGRRDREAFLKTLKSERDRQHNAKQSSDERKEFYDSQEERRREFFANEADQHKDFDSKMSEDRKQFDDYMKQKTDQFESDMRAYTTAFYDRKKNEALQKDARERTRQLQKLENDLPPTSPRRAGQSDEMDEFSTIPQGPGIRLGPPNDDSQ